MLLVTSLRRAASAIAENEFWLWWAFGAPLLLASSLPAWLFGLTLGVVPLLWLSRRAARGSWSVATPLDVPLALLLGLGIVTVVVSIDPRASLVLYGQWFGLVALYYSIVNSVTASRVNRAVWLLIGVGAGMALLGLLGLRFSEKFLPTAAISILPELEFGFLNPRGFTPNIVAGAIAPLVPLGLAFGLSRTGWQRYTAWAAEIGTFGVLVLTQSRGALLGVGLGLGFIVTARLSRGQRRAVVAGVVIVAAWVVVQSSSQLAPFVLGELPGTTGSRLELWDRAVLMLRDFPFTGVGLGQFEPVVRTLYPLFVNSPDDPVPHAHNTYLQMGVDFGVGGLVAFVGALAAALLVGAGTVARTHGKDWLALGLFGGYLVILVHFMFDAVFVSTKVAFTTWFLIGIMVTYWQFAGRAGARPASSGGIQEQAPTARASHETLPIASPSAER